MARTEATLPGGARLADYLTVGYLALNCSLGQVKEALVSCGVQTRLRRDMPREVLVYFVMAMCLYPRVAYEEVFRLVIEGLRRIYGDQVRDAQVSKAAISLRRYCGSASGTPSRRYSMTRTRMPLRWCRRSGSKA